MLYSGSDLIRMGALQTDRLERIETRGAAPRVVKSIDLGLEGESPQPQPRPSKRLKGLLKALALPAPTPHYGPPRIPKKGEFLDIFA